MKIEKQISFIEYQLRSIFSQNKIRAIDVVQANKLFEKWKDLTGYVSDKTPACKDCPEIIIDEEPKWKN
jgi:phage FluMu protein Com